MSLAEHYRAVAERAVAEDLGRGDPTSSVLGARRGTCGLYSRGRGVISGVGAAEAVLQAAASLLRTDPPVVGWLVADGDRVEPGQLLARMIGPAQTLLAAERSILNLITHMSGIATLTAAFVEAVAGTKAQVRDTRKTLPGLRYLEKYAVRCGGGVNHRIDLAEVALVKDNHIAAWGGLRPAVEAVRKAYPSLDMEVEVESLEQVREALEIGCDLILLDNMDIPTMARAVAMAKGRARTEASGGISLPTARSVAVTGVDYIAVGALTHSAAPLDMSVEWIA